MKTQKPKTTIKLFAPSSFWRSDPKVIEAVTNGCGPQGWKVDVIPDKILGLEITIACRIHDWMYGQGTCMEDKATADRVFLNNLLRIIDAKTKLRPLRLARKFLALIYYEAVHLFGGPAFWKGKNLCEELGEVEIG